MRPALRLLGTVLAWMILFESAASILLARPLVRDLAVEIYNLSHPYIRSVMEGITLALFALVELWHALLSPVVSLIENIFQITVPYIFIEIVIIFAFAARSIFMARRRWIDYLAILNTLRERRKTYSSENYRLPDYAEQKVQQLAEEDLDGAECAKLFEALAITERVQTASGNLEYESFLVTEELCSYCHRHVRLEFVKSLIENIGIVPYHDLPATKLPPRPIASLLILEYLITHSKIDADHIPRSAPHLSKALRERINYIIIGLSNDARVMINPKELKASNFWLTDMSHNLFHSDIGVLTKIRAIIVQCNLDTVLRPAFMRIGRASRIAYSCVSGFTIIIFMLDILYQQT